MWLNTQIRIAYVARGLRKLALKHWYFGLGEFFRSAYLRSQVRQLQKYVPDVTIDDVVRYCYAVYCDGGIACVIDGVIMVEGLQEFELKLLMLMET